MRQLACWTLLVSSVVVSAGVPCAAQGMISPATAMRYGLKRAWFAQLGSSATSGRLSHVNLDEGMLLVQSKLGRVTAVDAETGRTLWSTRVGHREGSEPAANSKHVVVLNGSTLFVLDRFNGAVLWERRVRGAPGAGPGISETHAFVPMVSGLIEGYDLEEGPRQTPWNYQSTGHVLLPPMTTPLTASWTTDKGFFYVADPAGGGIRYRLETRGAIHSQPTAWSPRLFAASVDGYVYALDERKGHLDWKYVVGEPMYERPVAIEDKVFAISHTGGLYCLDSEKGTLTWQARGIEQFVSMSPSRVYVVNTLGQLEILDASTGASLAAMPISRSTRMLVNPRSDRIFLVDHSALIQCLHEPQLVSPVVYTPPAAEEAMKAEPKKPSTPPPADKPEAEQPAEVPADDQPEGPPADDPFAPPAGGDDPFAPPADGDNPFAPPADVDNPFAPSGGESPF